MMMKKKSCVNIIDIFIWLKVKIITQSHFQKNGQIIIKKSVNQKNELKNMKKNF